MLHTLLHSINTHDINQIYGSLGHNKIAFQNAKDSRIIIPIFRAKKLITNLITIQNIKNTQILITKNKTKCKLRYIWP